MLPYLRSMCDQYDPYKQTFVFKVTDFNVCFIHLAFSFLKKQIDKNNEEHKSNQRFRFTSGAYNLFTSVFNLGKFGFWSLIKFLLFLSGNLFFFDIVNL